METFSDTSASVLSYAAPVAVDGMWRVSSSADSGRRLRDGGLDSVVERKSGRVRNVVSVVCDGGVRVTVAIDDDAKSGGMTVSLTTLGPGSRSVVRSSRNETQILVYGEAFVRPTGNLLHLDKMEVFGPMLKLARKENNDFTGGGTTLGVGLLLGYSCLLHVKEQQCIEGKFLAIGDEDFQHK